MTRPRDPTQFTRESAERIANVVRAAELATPRKKPITFAREDFIGGRGRVFRICTYTGAWSIGDTKTVTFKYQPNTPNTAVATNLFFPITNTSSSSKDCAIARDGTNWYLIDVRFVPVTAIFAGATQSVSVFGTSGTSIIRFAGLDGTVEQTVLKGPISATLDTGACTISVSAGEATIIGISTSGTQTALTVSMGSTQRIIVMSSTFTSTFVRLE